ncbi:MAG TPA: ATP-dependent 6-phosphofructokinase [Spirochaetales bacterium]|nr:ATP-dependent 6-phosphofructokinase [Spirochaetales bacterium]HOV37145.1 ATP-dependent 6-phosphofructokinase [Spirochaetales bacterium]
MTTHPYDFTVPVLGECKIPSPIHLSTIQGDKIANYVGDEECIIADIDVNPSMSSLKIDQKKILQKAGPRQKIYFNPGHVHAGIVTCGGLCPGLNDVIRSIVRCLWHSYGVRRISGIQFGYKGLLPEYQIPTIDLDIDVVDDIHRMGGSVLGSSRGGGERTEEIVDSLERLNLNMLFTIGGDGTQKGAIKIADEINRRGLKIAVVGIPKTIDNDLAFIQKSFGFETAVSYASRAVYAAHTEAHSALNGIGLVKLMGRESGFIAAYTALACHEANFVLIPEVPFDLEGPNGLLEHLKKRLQKRNHAVIIVAEGTGQDMVGIEEGTDASGNRKLKDIGVFLRDKISAYFTEEKMEVNLKYIDPGYIIRSAPADPEDSAYCSRLGSNAVHAAMAGKTKILISQVNNTFVHLPIEVAVSTRNRIDPESSLWRDVLEATNQPVIMKNGIHLGA